VGIDRHRYAADAARKERCGQLANQGLLQSPAVGLRQEVFDLQVSHVVVDGRSRPAVELGHEHMPVLPLRR
jgi:hypothetical protein